MVDHGVTLPLWAAEDSHAFSDYLNRFLESRSAGAGPANADAPSVMVRTDFRIDGEIKTVIFQERPAAAAFSTGWLA